MATDPDEFELLLDRAVRRSPHEVAVSSGPPAEVVEKVRLAGATAAGLPAGSMEGVDASDTSSLPTVLARRYGVKLMRPRNLAAIAAAASHRARHAMVAYSA